MITNNYYQILLGQTFGMSTSFIDTNGTSQTASYNGVTETLQNFTTMNGLNSTGNILLGSGTAAPSASDYNIKNPIDTSNLSISVNYTSRENGSVLTRIAKITIINNGTSSVTINEIGYAPNKYITLTGTASVLLDRSLLSEPLVIPPDSVGRIYYQIDIDVASLYAEAGLG